MMAKIRNPLPRKSSRKAGVPKSLAPDPGAAEIWLTEAVRQLFSLLGSAVKGAGIKPFSEHPEPPLAKSGTPPGGKDSDMVIYSVEQDTLWINSRLGIGLEQRYTAPHGNDTVRILEFILHELIHYLLGYECGHRGLFAQVAVAVGFTGRLTYPTSNADLLRELTTVAKRLGDFPNEAVTTAAQVDAPGHRRQRNRNRKYVCKRCGKIIRTAGTDLQAVHLCNGSIQQPYGYFALDD